MNRLSTGFKIWGSITFFCGLLQVVHHVLEIRLLHLIEEVYSTYRGIYDFANQLANSQHRQNFSGVMINSSIYPNRYEYATREAGTRGMSSEKKRIEG